ncbi:MAG: S1C family serine protease [Anaerolineae bacterium]
MRPRGLLGTRNRLLLTVALLLVVSLGCFAAPTLTPASPTPAPSPTSVPATSEPLVVVPDDPLQDLQSAVEAVYAAAGDSVVNIAVTTIGYDFFLNPVPQEGSGSGFVYDDQGHIITNFHVVEGADEINVTFADGTTLVADVIGQDPTYDLAVVRVDPDEHPLRPVPLGDSESLRIGQFVVAIGNPFGLEQSLSFGVISSLGRIIESPNERFIGEVIQTDAAINPGNSGGPLLDLEGRVIGVNAQIVSPSRANAGIGFAIPAQIVERVVPELIETGVYRHPVMGVLPVTLSPQLKDILREANYEVPEDGVLVVEVTPNSGADRAGIRGPQRQINTPYGRLPVGGDIIIALDDTAIQSSRDLIAYLETFTQPGQTVDVTVFRDGETLTVPVELGERVIQ